MDGRMTLESLFGKSESPDTSSGSFAVVALIGVPSMPTTITPFSASILYRNQRKTVDLLEAAAKEWAERAQRNEQLNAESASLLAQMVRMCLRSPAMMRDLWEWGKAEELAEQDRQRAGDDLREQLGAWLQLLGLIQAAAIACEAESYPLRGAAELDGAADEMRAILQEVNETWPPQGPSASPILSYEELRSLADRYPPPPQWYEETDDLF